MALIALSAVLPADSIATDLESRTAHSRDESEAITEQLPAAVIRVRTTEQVAHVMRIASEHLVPVTPRAGGTGRTGGAVPMHGGIVMAFEQMNRILEIDAVDKVAVVEPGVVTGALHSAAEDRQLLYPPDPNSWESCCLGGNIAENASGPKTLQYGPTRDYVLGLEVVTADGNVLNLGRRTTKGVSGYDLASLVVGSEGTLAIVTRATLKLLPAPQSVVTLLLGFDSDTDAVDAAERIMSRTSRLPRCLELIGATVTRLAAPGEFAQPAVLIVETDGDEREALERANTIAEIAKARSSEVATDANVKGRERIWGIRRNMSRTLRQAAKFKLSEDIVVPRRNVRALLEQCEAISTKRDLVMPVYGHLGDANLHVNFLWDDDDARARVEPAIEELMRAVITLGGTLTGEHGIGVLKAPYFALEHGPREIELHKQVKNLFDPKGILNPGKIFTGAPKHAC